MLRIPTRGKFIVIEGIDGAGGETQTKRLLRYLKKQKISVASLSYPDYKGPIGELIKKYLYKKYNFAKDVQLLLYFADFLKDKEKIERWLAEGKTIVSDRYFSSTVAYQCLNGFPVEGALEVAKLFDLPIPDLIIYVDISPETSMKRKAKEKRAKLDRNESNKKFLTEIRAFYKELAARQVFARWNEISGEEQALGRESPTIKLAAFHVEVLQVQDSPKWIIIDGERSKDEVFEEIKKLI